MSSALERAEQAYQQNEVPVGAIIVAKAGNIIGQGFNQKEQEHDPTAHAEIIAIKDAAKNIANWRLIDATIYVTLEPCPMCLSAIQHARLSKLVFGAYDSKGGSISLGYNLYNDKRLNHSFSVIGGIEHYKCSKLLSDFFRKQRESYQSMKLS